MDTNNSDSGPSRAGAEVRQLGTAMLPIVTESETNGFLVNNGEIRRQLREQIVRDVPVELTEESALTLPKFIIRNSDRSRVAPANYPDDMDRIVMDVYMENTFRFSSIRSLTGFKKRFGDSRSSLHQIKNWTQLRNLWVLVPCAKIGKLSFLIRPFKKLRVLIISVDEAEMVRVVTMTAVNADRDIYPECEAAPVPTAIDRQRNLIVLRQYGVASLCSRHVPLVKFTAMPREGSEMVVRGPIPGGILETIVAKQMMTPPHTMPTTTDMSFRFLDLPAEIRIMVYKFALTVDGKIHPRPREPSSFHVTGTTFRKPPAVPTPSVLALLQASKLVHQEAFAFFYSQNSFVFYHHQQLQMFLCSISDERKDCLTSITLWYTNECSKSLGDLIDPALHALLMLPRLKTLVIDIGNITYAWGLKRSDMKLGNHRIGYRLVAKSVDVQVVCSSLERHVFVNGATSAHGQYERLREGMIKKAKAIFGLDT